MESELATGLSAYTPVHGFCSVSDISTNYAPIPDDGYLHVPDSSGYFMQKALRVGYRAPVFRIIEDKDIVLKGYRTYLTKDGFYFNDTSFLPGAPTENIQSKFNGGRNEDTGSNFLGRFLQTKETDQKISIDNPVISIASDEPSNWGSWLFRIIPKLISVANRNNMAVLAPQFAPWMKNLINLMYGNIEIIPQVTRASYQLSHVLVPSIRNYGAFYDQETKELYREIADKVKIKSKFERVYLSRKSSSARRPEYRSIQNEGDVCSALNARGFEIIDLEKLTLEQQISVIRDAKIIIIPGGAGLFNMVFASNAKFVLDIEPNNSWLYAHHSILKSCGISHSILFGDQPDREINPHSSWYIDTDKIIYCLKSI